MIVGSRGDHSPLTRRPLIVIRRDDTHEKGWFSPALAGQDHKASSLFFVFGGACVLTHFPHRRYRDDNHTSLLPHTLCTGLAFFASFFRL